MHLKDKGKATCYEIHHLFLLIEKGRLSTTKAEKVSISNIYTLRKETLPPGESFVL